MTKVFLSSPSPHTKRICSPLVVKDVALHVVHQFRHRFQMIPPSAKIHSLLHNLAIILTWTDLSKHILSPRLDSARYRNTASHDCFHPLPGECDGLLRVRRDASFVKHHDSGFGKSLLHITRDVWI